MPVLPVDEPVVPRPDEELETVALAGFLQDSTLVHTPPLSIRQYPRGFSNLTYRVTDAAGRAWVLRTPPIRHNIPTAHDVGREFRILTGLQSVYACIPEPLLYCPDHTVLGRPFYLMRCVQGTILRADMDAAAAPAPALMRRIGHSFIANLAALHAVDWQATLLAGMGRPQGYVERQIGGWARRYRAARTDNAPDMDAIVQWLDRHRPASPPATLIHNDYKYDNVILDPQDPARILAVLDWEMATVGDPLMDLGTCLAYWVCADDPPVLQALHHSPTHLPGNPARREVVEQYARDTGRNVDAHVFYFVFGHMKLATILQQLHVRWVQGLTTEARYARLDREVRACHWTALQAMQLNRIDDLFTA